MNIFDFMYDNYKIDKPIRLIELFAGYGIVEDVLMAIFKELL